MTAMGAGKEVQEDTTGRKICRAGCSVLALGLAVGFGLSYAMLAGKAGSYNKLFPDAMVRPYDTCFPYYQCEDPQWDLVFT